jgi:succinate dehydrogenase / fumarate reductase membrane anchor subunit
MSSSATKAYVMQRVTGATMILISLWIMFFLIPKVGDIIFNYNGARNITVDEVFTSPVNIALMITFAICGLYHGTLGMQSIIHDYIQCHVVKKVAVIVVISLAIFSSVSLSIFCIDMHVKSIRFKSSEMISHNL